MRDPKSGYVVVPALAPALYAQPNAGVIAPTPTAADPDRAVWAGPDMDLRGFRSVALVVDVGAAVGGSEVTLPDDGGVVSLCGLSVKIQHKYFGGYEDAGAMMVTGGRCLPAFGWIPIPKNSTRIFAVPVLGETYRVLVGVRKGFSVAASAICLKGHPIQSPAQ